MELKYYGKYLMRELQSLGQIASVIPIFYSLLFPYIFPIFMLHCVNSLCLIMPQYIPPIRKKSLILCYITCVNYVEEGDFDSKLVVKCKFLFHLFKILHVLSMEPTIYIQISNPFPQTNPKNPSPQPNHTEKKLIMH